MVHEQHDGNGRRICALMRMSCCRYARCATPMPVIFIAEIDMDDSNDPTPDVHGLLHEPCRADAADIFD